MSSRTFPMTDPLTDEEVFAAHAAGKLKVSSKRPLVDQHDLSIAYTPGVARVCEAIAADPSKAREYTGIRNTVAIVSDGSAVLGLGNIGAAAALPVMEGKAQLFSSFAGLNAVPIVVDTQDTEEIIRTVEAIAPSFGAINLEDIAAPRCFEVEDRLVEKLDLPVMHDDQHGTAVVITAALRNAARVSGREFTDLKVVVSGAGAAGVACVNMLIDAGLTRITVCDSRGVIHADREGLSPVKQKLAAVTNPSGVTGDIANALTGADTFIGLSRGRIGEAELKVMSPRPILFSLANPIPEIDPDLAYRYGGVVATGRSDLPNQINNVLAFPGIFHGALEAGATAITPAMRLAASRTIAELALEDLDAEHIVPAAMDPRVAPTVSKAVAEAWNG